MARPKKKTTIKRKASKKKAPRSTKIRRQVRRLAVPRPRVPARKKGESLVRYHDRLSDLIYEATAAGDLELSAALQEKAGALARQHTSIHEPRGKRARREGRRGPGTYPWNQCIEDQMAQYGSMDKAKRVCGRIRASSRSRYPIYWSLRGLGRRKNPDGSGDYAIVAAQDENGWHWWASDERGMKPAAASTQPEPDEESAIRVAKRAIRKYEARVYPTKTAPKKGKKVKKAKSDKRRIASILRGL